MARSIARFDAEVKLNLGTNVETLRRLVRFLDSLGGNFKDVARVVEGEMPDRVSLVYYELIGKA